MLYSCLPCPNAPDRHAVLIFVLMSLSPSFSLRAHFQVVLLPFPSFLSLEASTLHSYGPYGLWFQSPHSTSFSFLDPQDPCPFPCFLLLPLQTRPDWNNCKHLSCQKDTGYLPASFQFLLSEMISRKVYHLWPLLRFGITYTDLTSSSENSSFLIFLIGNQTG